MKKRSNWSKLRWNKIEKKLSKATKKKIAWKMERRKKYSKTADKSKKPAPGVRSKFWVSGYKKADGKKIKGHWRCNAFYNLKKGLTTTIKSRIKKLEKQKKVIKARIKKKPKVFWCQKKFQNLQKKR